MTLEEYLPFWKQLTSAQQNLLGQAASIRTAKAGEPIHRGSEDCVGLLIVLKGRLRAYPVCFKASSLTSW